MAAPQQQLPQQQGKYLHMNDALFSYMVKHGVREHPVLKRLRELTHKQFPADKEMQISQEEGAFLQLLVRATGAKRCIEVGVFTGYSSLSVALALPSDGKIVALDVSEEWTAVARRHWAEAGVAAKLDLRIAPAVQSLDAMLAKGGEANSYDFAFIDADKGNYKNYYERILKLLKPGGVIAIDNVLWSGKVAQPIAVDDEKTRALDELNKFIAQDKRVEVAMVPVADGITLCWKKRSGARQAAL